MDVWPLAVDDGGCVVETLLSRFDGVELGCEVRHGLLMGDGGFEVSLLGPTASCCEFGLSELWGGLAGGAFLRCRHNMDLVDWA